MAHERPNYIHLLPDEVLCLVFDRLDLQSVKNASRTCRRWNDIIFLSGYISRFRIRLDPVKHAGINWLMSSDPSRSWEERMIRMARHTKRCYRNILVCVSNGTENMHMNVWNFIHPKITSNIRELYVCYVNAKIRDLLPKIIAAVPSMLQLQSLAITDKVTFSDLHPEIFQKNIPTIRSKSLEKLSMLCNYKCALELPQLQIYHGSLSALSPSVDSSQPVVFVNIKNIKVSVKSWNTVDPTIFSQMLILESIEWRAPMETDLLIAMIERCPSLTKVLVATPSASNLCILKHLVKFSQLRSLMFGPIMGEDDLFLDLSKLIHLDVFILHCRKLIPFSLLSLPKSLTCLGLNIVPEYEQSQMKIISCHMTQLKKFFILYHEAPVSNAVQKALPCLKQLDELGFNFCHFTSSFFPGIDAPLHRLGFLHLRQCKLEMKHLFGLNEKFPNLKTIEFQDCCVTTESGCDPRFNHTLYSPFPFF